MCGAQQLNSNETMSLGLNDHALFMGNGPIQPQPMDVLCGKSKQCVDHGGSRRFREVIECYREQYQQALTKWDKTSVTRNIYDHLSQAGSRFLKFDDKLQIWEEVSPMAARDKIGHALRFANRVTRRKRDASDAQPQPHVATLQQISPTQFIQLQQMVSLASSPPAVQLVAAPVPEESTPSATFSHATPTAPFSQNQQIFQESFVPLGRPEGWFQNFGETESNLKCPSKPTELCPLDDTLSLESILPLNQIAEENSSSSVPKEDLSFVDLDFDREILSVLF